MTHGDVKSAAPSRTGLGRTIVTGAVAGVLASLVMAVYAMVAAWTKDTGFVTPLYHIASVWIAQDSMMSSMQDGMAGDAFHFDYGPAVLGALIHMATGAAYGILFALAVSRLALGTAVLSLAGLVWGGLVFVFSTFVGLPVAAALFDSGKQITDMAKMAGWGTFISEHLLYGGVLGVLLALLVRRTSARSA
jgi:hypothetical protein